MYDQGYEDYCNGREETDNPFPPESIEYGEWLEGWTDSMIDDTEDFLLDFQDFEDHDNY